MVTLPSPNPLDRILSEHPKNITGLLLGTATYGQRVQLVRYEGVTEYANTLGVPDTTNGRALKIQYGDPAAPVTLATFQKSGITLQSADGTKAITISNTGITVTGGFLVFDIVSYGAIAGDVAIGVSNQNKTSILLAATAASAAGGGIVHVPAGIFYWTGATVAGVGGMTFLGAGVKIRGVGQIDSNLNPRSSLINRDAAPLCPLYVFGGAAAAGSGSFSSFEDINLEGNAVPAATTYGGGTVSATILLDRMRGQSGSSAEGSQFTMRNVRLKTSLDGIQAGTIDNPYSAAWLTVEHCEFTGSKSAIVIKGCDYLFVRDCVAEQAPGQNGFAWILMDGAATNQPDGAQIYDNFIEDYSIAIQVSATNGSVGNTTIRDNHFDGPVTGIFLAPNGATINSMWIAGNTFNGAGGNGYGVLVTQLGTSEVRRLTISNNIFINFENQGILVTDPPAGTTPYVKNLQIHNNEFRDTGTGTTNTFPGIDIEAYVTPILIRNNTITSPTAANKNKYGVRVAANVAAFNVSDNHAPDALTAPTRISSAQHSVTGIARDNTGGPAAGTAGYSPISFASVIGPWGAKNLSGAFSNTDLPLAQGDAGATADSVLGIPATFAGRIIGISGSASANIAGASAVLTFTFTKNGTEGTMAVAITTAEAISKKTAVQVTGDDFVAGDLLGVSVTATGTLTANDLSATLVFATRDNSTL